VSAGDHAAQTIKGDEMTSFPVVVPILRRMGIILCVAFGFMIWSGAIGAGPAGASTTGSRVETDR
jgi:hypothetical protein